MRKTYKGFVLWLVFYTVCILAISILPAVNEEFWDAHVPLLARIVDCMCMAGILPLLYYIYRTGYAYLFSGITYEQAVAAGRRRCRLYAKRHLKIFGIFTAALIVFSAVMEIVGAPMWIDLAFFIGGIVVVSIRSMFYKL